MLMIIAYFFIFYSNNALIEGDIAIFGLPYDQPQHLIQRHHETYLFWY